MCPWLGDGASGLREGQETQGTPGRREHRRGVSCPSYSTHQQGAQLKHKEEGNSKTPNTHSEVPLPRWGLKAAWSVGSALCPGCKMAHREETTGRDSSGPTVTQPPSEHTHIERRQGAPLSWAVPHLTRGSVSRFTAKRLSSESRIHFSKWTVAKAVVPAGGHRRHLLWLSMTAGAGRSQGQTLGSQDKEMA